MNSISVLICTRNRDKILHRCLSSLTRQTHAPDEVIIVDNGSTDDTKTICISFSTVLPVRYLYEARIGIPYGRNAGIRYSSSNICAFIDDDCIADSDWLTNIDNHFAAFRASGGVVGFSYNLTPANIPSQIEQLYYERWVSENVPNPNKASVALSGKFIDFKNCAFRHTIIKKHRFSPRAPFGDVGDEDIEIGNRIYKKSTALFFDPSIIVRHENSQTSRRLLYRNFWEGFACRLLLQKGLNIRKTLFPKSRIYWYIKTVKKILIYKPMTNKIFLLPLLLLYPLSSIAGNLCASLSIYLHIPTRIPKRK